MIICKSALHCQFREKVERKNIVLLLIIIACIDCYDGAALVEHIDEETDDESIPQQKFEFTSPHKQTTKHPHPLSSDYKDHSARIPPLLRIPRELRWTIFDELIAQTTEIEIGPSTIDSFHALRLTTKSLREEVKAWAKKRPDLINAFPYGYFKPSQTAFVLKIDHRWNKVFKHKTVSGSHVTFRNRCAKSGTRSGDTTGIKYMTREQAWYSFCRSQMPKNIVKMNLKIEIRVHDGFAPENLSSISRNELFDVLAAARYHSGAPWASMRLYLHGTLDQIDTLDDIAMVPQLWDLVHLTQQSQFDEQTWKDFRDSRWSDNDYDALEYPFKVIYWEDEKCMLYKRKKDGELVYEFGGRVMEFIVNSAEDMRRGPVSSSLTLAPQSSKSLMHVRSSSLLLGLE
ncbi:2b90cef9-552d-4eab-88bc-f7505a906556 [Sclerotinia trifoliorum]|uniref:2b90cef9-552d-4eab-88bc-f7505a906556 n=1 Tax=Sclerotinia trifoliorum TaxID=28548 RepID=A0A8H2ZS66_9HELO|nr:2b90cef9-552d-4eab-88bc-f7505a906556 [Sclerotinia trifoliorum]